MKKRLISPVARRDPAESDWLPLAEWAEVEITSESATHPIESAFGPGQDGWRAETAGEQTIRLRFDEPRALRRVRVVFEEHERARTQQFVLRAAEAGGGWRDVARQQFNFSPGGATREQEDFRVDLPRADALELTIIPDISGGEARASLQELRVA